MAHDPFSVYTFDPVMLRVLSAAFDAAWNHVEQHTAADDRTRVRGAIAAGCDRSGAIRAMHSQRP